MAKRQLQTSWINIFRTSAVLAGGLALAGLASSGTAEAQEDPLCLSFDPNDWPAPSKPYFMLALDTSGSMTNTVAATNSCGLPVEDRNSHLRCAVTNTTLAFGGQVNFGLATFAAFLQDCSGGCFADCNAFCTAAENSPPTSSCLGCGPMDDITDATTRRGALLQVPMQQDDFWNAPQVPSNVSEILAWSDDDCSDNRELAAVGLTPLNGILRDMERYFAVGWNEPDAPFTFYPTPLSVDDRDGVGINGGTGCRDLNIILLTDGDETCDNGATTCISNEACGGAPPCACSWASAAAESLYQTGVTVTGRNYKIRTHVINFVGGDPGQADAIAAAGGTGSSFFATNEVTLSQSLAEIISSAINPEVCDNTDNNCNGCTDEGYVHYCNQDSATQTCCAWGTPAERQTCLDTYTASIPGNPPDGDLTLLPCLDAGEQLETNNVNATSEWLCFDPGDVCDDVDNNCDGEIDEGALKCGNPLACPQPEVCDGVDQDCDGNPDNGVCGGCVPSPEICDGCDNDCDGIADNDAANLDVPCGLPAPPFPAYCAGISECRPEEVVAQGACGPNQGDPYEACTATSSAEICDGEDNDCNGVVDDGIAPTACEPNPPGTVYGPPSQCVMGTQACGSMDCVGAIGPSQEVCDGIDNDCNGVIDDGVFGESLPCGINQPPCTPGSTLCQAGVMICDGGTGPQPEICDGIDNNCNGAVDELPLTDGPLPGETGCWNDAGNCCTHQNLSWCPPAGGNCFDAGTLSAPCNAGTLACAGAAGWVCQNPTGPSPEVCDNVDNDCNNAVDDGNLPNVGDICGIDTGECNTGLVICDMGALDCDGDVGPAPEICDGLDNNCNTINDDGIPTGGACTPVYDTVAYPGPRDAPPCQPGILQCDGNGGIECIGGVGPTPETCDGVDNDCDGTIDEVGAAPDGLDGSQNPFPPPDNAIGDACGVNEGVCQEGAYACSNGVFVCLGGTGPQVESCDCEDNDCNGVIDNPNENDIPPLCGAGATCVQANDSCQCAKPCGGGENPCPPGQECESVTSSETGQPLGNFCVAQTCINCEQQTVLDGNGDPLCAPSGAVFPGCPNPPECVCKGQADCQSPCFGVTCDAPLVCATHGVNAGTCQEDNCWNAPCQGCDKACNLGSCVDNPCADANCAADETCKPNDNFTDFACVGSCADVTCDSGEECVDGTCVPTCDPACAADEVCDLSGATPACVANQCLDDPCTDGSCCDPVTGACGNCPCAGIICPDTQVCSDGQCGAGQGGEGGGGTGGNGTGASGSGGGDTGGGTGSGADGTGAGAGIDDDAAWGLATGGGGCACDVGTEGQRTTTVGWMLALMGLAAARLRRRKERPSRRGGEEVAR